MSNKIEGTPTRMTNRHRWTPEEDHVVRQLYRGTHQSCREIADHLTCSGILVTAFAVRGRVTKLGLGQRENRRWSNQELKNLREWTGRYPPTVIAQKLNRGKVSVTVKMKKMGLLRRERVGWYTKCEVAEMLGVDHKKVQQWMDAKYLKAVPYGVVPHNGGGIWYIKEEDLRTFLLKYSYELVGRNLDVYQVFSILVPMEPAPAPPHFKFPWED